MVGTYILLCAHKLHKLHIESCSSGYYNANININNNNDNIMFIMLKKMKAVMHYSGKRDIDIVIFSKV